MHRLPLFLDLNTNNCLVFILLIHQNIMYDKWQLLVPNMIWEHSGTVAIWTGVADFETESHFVWVASGRDANMYYSNWYIGDPNGSFNENCTEIWTKTLNGDIYWNDLNCYNLRNYACFFWRDATFPYSDIVEICKKSTWWTFGTYLYIIIITMGSRNDENATRVVMYNVVFQPNFCHSINGNDSFPIISNTW